MSTYRELLAAVAALCGLVLIVLAARGLLQSRGAHSRRHSMIALYGFLFVVTAALLWSRGAQHREWTATPTPQAKADESASGDSVIVDAPAGGRPRDAGIEKSAQARESAVFELLPAPVAGKRNVFAPVRIAPLTEDPGRRADARSAAGQSPDEQVYLAVERLFDSIERWFDRYGSPAHEDAITVPRRGIFAAPVVMLPEVMFLEGTAELTLESVERLREIAVHLRNGSGVRVVEIHAQAGGDAPEAFQHILTQARAEVVRDFLMNEGVPNCHFIAKAMGSQIEDSTAANAQIRFVFRP